MLEVFAPLFVIYCVLFWISIKLQDNSIADVFWGLWFVIIAWLLFLAESRYSFPHILVLGVINIWWLRLFLLFLRRKIKHSYEDPRYSGWRKKWKYFYTRSFFQVYMLQMSLMLTIAIPLFLIYSVESLNISFLIVWVLIALLGFIYELIADRQIITFIKNKKKWENKVYTWGLWKYSRNPNYLWESVFWLGISIISFPVSLFWIVGFLLITFLLLYVSWVPMKEKRQARKDNWAQYAAKTNKFIPWPIKNEY